MLSTFFEILSKNQIFLMNQILSRIWNFSAGKSLILVLIINVQNGKNFKFLLSNFCSFSMYYPDFIPPSFKSFSYNILRFFSIFRLLIGLYLHKWILFLLLPKSLSEIWNQIFSNTAIPDMLPLQVYFWNFRIFQEFPHRKWISNFS